MLYFADWGYLFLLLLILGLWFWYRRYGRRREGTLRYASLRGIRDLPVQRASRRAGMLYGLRLLALALLILALARPQQGESVKEFQTEGIDIMLVLDISSSMRAVDFQPNRLEAAKTVARQFIEGRQSDRIGLVVFAAESFLQCPLTIDYDVLKQLLDQVDIIEEKYDGTAIGMAIANGVNRLRESAAKSKIIILLSDGRNNAGELDPETAADMAKAFDIKIYTIGAGKLGQAPYPVQMGGGRVQYRLVDVEIDEAVLQGIAQNTGGRYFRATDETHLASIYEEISRMEKTEVRVKEYLQYRDLYPVFLLPAFLLIGLAIILEQGIWRRLP
ncbi:MAG: vWA domain-containing protein [Fidelibacterota bacterium]